MKHTRERYQQGSLTVEKRKNGPDVWVYRWRERQGTATTLRKRIVGTKATHPTKAAAAKAVHGMKLDINRELSPASPSQKLQHTTCRRN